MPGFQKLVLLAGSEKKEPRDKAVGEVPDASILDVTLVVQRKKLLPDLKNGMPSGFKVLSRKKFELEYGASKKSFALIEMFANQHGFTIAGMQNERRAVTLKGSAAEMKKAFGLSMKMYQTPKGDVYRGRSGAIMIPEELIPVIEGVFGLDDRVAARAMFLYRKDGDIRARAVGLSYNPNDLASIYNFPTDATGKGQCIGIIELGGGYRINEIQQYFTDLNLPIPQITAISVDGGVNNPDDGSGANAEVALDIEVAGAVAPAAKIAVYFAPNTDQGFLNAITTALHDTANNPSVISISWGQAESGWTQQSLTSFNDAFQSAAALGVTVFAAAGDSGSDDSVGDGKAHVDFPASSPYVIGCGGTNLTADPTNGITAETVWHAAADSATGGGVSDVFDLPDYQGRASVPPSANDGKRIGRGVPDVSAVADPATGYNILVDGQMAVIGGTSAVAPLMAGLTALLNEKLGKPVGFLSPVIYGGQGAGFNDITQGDNITTPNNLGYTAGFAWDACTGWGSPDGVAIYDLISGQYTS